MLKSREMPILSTPERKWAFFAIAFLVFLTYLPAFHGNYLHTEDYFWSSFGDFSCSTKVKFNAEVGRPLLGLMFCAAPLVHALPWMSLFRFLSALNLVFIGYFSFRWLRKNRVEAVPSVLLSAILLTLPTFMVYAAYLVSACVGVAATLALLAFWRVHRVVEGRHWINPKADLGVAVLILILSLLIYPTGTLIYCAMFVVPLVMENENFMSSRWRLVGFAAAALGIAMVIYYIAWRVGLGLYGIPPLGKYDARSFVSDPVERAGWFVEGPLFEITNLWNVFPGSSLSLIVMSVLLAAFGLDLASSRAWVERGWKALSFFAFLELLAVSFAVNLVSSNPSMEYRGYPALYCVFGFGLFLYVYKALRGRGLVHFVNPVLGACLAIGVFCANHSLVSYFVIPDSSEFNYIKGEIVSFLRQGRRLDHIHFVLLKPSFRLVTQRNELGQPTLAHEPSLRPLVRAALLELAVAKDPQITIDVRDHPEVWFEFGTVFQDNTALPGRYLKPTPPEDTLTIDMSQWHA